MLNIKKILNNILLIVMILIVFMGCNKLLNYQTILAYIFGLLPLVMSILDKKINFRKSFVTVLWSLIGIVLVSGLLYTISFSETSKNMYIYIMGILFLIFREDKSIYTKFLKVTLGLAVVHAISVIFMSVFTNEFINIFKGWFSSLDLMYEESNMGMYSGLSGEKAYAATVLNIGIGIIFAKFFKNKKIKMKDVLALSVLFLALFLTGKRLLTVLPILILIISALAIQNKKVIKRVSKILIALALFAIIIFSVYPKAYNVIDRLLNDDDNGRENFKEYAIEMYENKKLLGYGLNTFNDYIYERGFRYYDEKWNFGTHNIYYQILAENGIIGFSLIVSAMLSALVLTIKKIRKYIKKENYENIELLYFSLYIQLLFIIYGYTGNTFYYIQQLYLYFIALAMMIDYGKYERKENE